MCTVGVVLKQYNLQINGISNSLCNFLRPRVAKFVYDTRRPAKRHIFDRESITCGLHSVHVPVLLRQPKKRLIGGMASPFHRHANGLMPASTPSPGAGISWHVFPRTCSTPSPASTTASTQHQPYTAYNPSKSAEPYL
ncbi:hypothetical protein Naga_100654g5 [Nannochloropsis gaditana]|uniref:Uncharacterized protein n=1 Tax=Nannochloropsis gaditana TaxID=72520 RepID=W7TK11_9STRA|nr:hypothetical protein Naga_100654g5 [Nannochloropsis gaditana]